MELAKRKKAYHGLVRALVGVCLVICCSQTVRAEESCLCTGEGHLQGIQLKYTGEDCSASNHSQGEDYTTCSGDPEYASPVRIVASSRSDLSDSKTKISFDGTVSVDDGFFLAGVQTKHLKVSPNTHIRIYSSEGALLQYLHFHTSCSRPINIGDQFGSVLVIGGIQNGENPVDECGICGGDGSSCLDCHGIPNGGAEIDDCGVCGGTSACFDCAGTPYGTAEIDQCSLCGGDGTSCLDCAGTPDGNAEEDLCGVCNGTNDCLDCAGVPFGDSELDQCGVCDGDNACLTCEELECDCTGVPNGSAEVDLCGVCGGENDCLDCEGTPFGTAKVDKCGVCGGSDACVDCAGVPGGNAVLDECGVCDGNGSSCLECEESNLDGIRALLDGSGYALSVTVRRALKNYKRVTRRRSNRFINTAKGEANDLYMSLWQISYSFPPIVLQCRESPRCVNVSSVSDVESYREGVARLRRLLNRVTKKTLRRTPRAQKVKRARSFRRLRKAFLKQEAETEASLGLIPETMSRCTVE